MEFYNTGIKERAVQVSLFKSRKAVLNDGWVLEKIKSPFSRIYVVKKGSGVFRCGDQETPITDKTVYVIPPEIEFSGEADYLEKLYFHISVQTFDGYDIYANLADIYTLPYNEAEYNTLFDCLMSESYYDKVRLKQILLSILDRMRDAHSLPDPQIKQHSDLVSNILAYIQANLSLKLRVCDISAALFVSDSKVRETFRKEMGLPIGKYIDDMVFTKARHYLAVSNMSMLQISTTLGFCDQFYFSRQFSKKYGLSPSQFRKKIQS